MSERSYQRKNKVAKRKNDGEENQTHFCVVQKSFSIFCQALGFSVFSMCQMQTVQLGSN